MFNLKKKSSTKEEVYNMGAQLTWEEVLAKKDLIGDAETQENDVVYRGPVAEIRDEGDAIHIMLSWCARLGPTTGQWEKWDSTLLTMNKKMRRPQDIGGGRIFFEIPFVGICTLFPKGGSRLDPAKVKDLEVG